MITAVVDTNLVVSGVISEIGAPRQLLIRLRRRQFTLILSAEQLVEINEVLARPHLVARYTLPSKQIQELVDLFAEVVMNDMLSTTTLITVRDAKDQHLLSAAFSNRADYLVSGDNDLLTLRDDSRLGDLRIVTAAEFLNVLNTTWS